MALNALGAMLAAMEVGGSVESVLDGLAGFEGVRRRFESVGTAAGVRVFDDYAHHPTEVRATLEAVRGVAGESRSIVVFQPHLYSRTKTFAREFGQALSAADEVFVLDVYAAREQPMAGVSGASVAEHVDRPGPLRAGLLGGRRGGRRGGATRRRHRHDGCGRRDAAGAGDPDGAAGGGRSTRPGARDERQGPSEPTTGEAAGETSRPRKPPEPTEAPEPDEPPIPRKHPMTPKRPTSRGRGVGRGASARSGAPHRPGRPRSSRLAGRPRSASRASGPIRPNPLREG